MKRPILFLLTMLLCLQTWAQQRTMVSGTVVSSTTGKELEGVSISGGGHTVVTNADGYFLLKADTLLSHITVSHVGYRSVRVEGDRLAADGGLRIRLQPAVIELPEVVVVSMDPRDLVAAAIRKIPKNYPGEPELFHCFYRETAMKRQHYILVAEGVVDMYKAAYRKGFGRDRVAIRKGRRLLSPKQSDTLSVKVTGGPVAPIQLDVVKNRDVLLNEEDLDCYAMTMELPTTIGDRSQYVVSIAPSCTLPYPLYFGKLYIDQETLAFTRVELSLDMSDREKATQMMLVRKPAGVRFRPKELSLLIDYRLEDGVARMSYVRTTFRFNCDWRRRLFATSFTACCEMVVTSREEGQPQPISGRDSFDQHDAFFDKVEYFRDPTFWDDYNIIEPTESLDRAVDRLLKRRQ